MCGRLVRAKTDYEFCQRARVTYTGQGCCYYWVFRLGGGGGWVAIHLTLMTSKLNFCRVIIMFGEETLTKICQVTYVPLGHAAAQVVSRWLPTAAARVRARVRLCGICGGRNGTRAGFLRVLPFPLPIITPTAQRSSSSIIRGWYNRPNSGRCTKGAQSHPTPRKYVRLDSAYKTAQCVNVTADHNMIPWAAV
jgi:hypothetical protein